MRLSADGRRVTGRSRSIVRAIAIGAMTVALTATALLYVVVDRVIVAADRRAAATAVDTDLTGLADIYASAGRNELVARIGDRLALSGTGQLPVHYLLRDAKGTRIAGDIDAPSLAAARSEAGALYIRGKSGWARAVRLRGGLSLVVAHETSGGHPLRQAVAIAFAIAGALIVLAVGLLALLTSRRLAARVDRISATFRDPDGPVALLAPVDLAPDEIGELARHAATALDRQRSLSASQRHVSDHVAHEVRTPLLHLDQRLIGLLKGDPTPPAAAALGQARSDVRSIVTMLDALLDIAASEAKRGDPTGLRPIDLSALIHDVVEVYASSLEEAGLGIEQAIAPDVIVPGEPMLLTRLLSNLLDNAIKYVPAGGTLSVELHAGGLMRLADDGPGIAVAQRATIFDRFRRGPDAGHGGHGLGLALARAIALRHGMTLTLEDRAVGCSFVLAPGTAA